MAENSETKGKQNWRPGTMIYPVPAALISCGSPDGKTNLFTASWVGTICSDPAMCYVSIRPERFSYGIIRSTMEFTINLTTEEIARATDWCGVRSGRDFDKWKECGLTPMPGVKVGCPFVGESPVSVECRVKTILPLGSHDMFIAEVVNVIADERYLDPDTGALRLDTAGLISYIHGGYYAPGNKLGTFGWTVRKKK